MSLSDDEWHRLEDNLTAVFRLYRSLIPALAPHGVFVQLNGMSAEILLPGSGGVALTAAATKSLTRTLAVELAGSGRRNAPRQDSAFLYVGPGDTPFAQANIVFAGDDRNAASAALQPFLGLPETVEQRAQVIPYATMPVTTDIPHNGQQAALADGADPICGRCDQ